MESVAELKDPTKHVLDDSDFFLSEYRGMVYEMRHRIDSYHEPYYEKPILSLSQQEIDELQSLTDACCEMMQNFVKQVKEGNWQQHA